MKLLPTTSPTGFPRKDNGVLGEVWMVNFSYSFLGLAFPPPLCTSVSLLLTLCVTSLMFQQLSWAELGATALGAQRRSL